MQWQSEWHPAVVCARHLLSKGQELCEPRRIADSRWILADLNTWTVALNAGQVMELDSLAIFHKGDNLIIDVMQANIVTHEIVAGPRYAQALREQYVGGMTTLAQVIDSRGMTDAGDAVGRALKSMTREVEGIDVYGAIGRIESAMVSLKAEAMSKDYPGAKDAEVGKLAIVAATAIAAIEQRS